MPLRSSHLNNPIFLNDPLQIGARIKTVGIGAGNYKCDDCTIREIDYQSSTTLDLADKIYSQSCGKCTMCVGQYGRSTATWFANRRDVVLLEDLKVKEMRKTIAKGSWARITDPTKIYKDLDEKAVSMGAETSKFFKSPVVKDQEGEVIGIDSEGYVLLDIDGSHVLIDIEGIVKIKKSTDIGYLIYFPATKNLEELETMDEVNSRIEELFGNGTINMSSQVKLYQVQASKKINMKLKVDFLE